MGAAGHEQGVGDKRADPVVGDRNRPLPVGLG
jgi:hypothetical protein